MKILIFSSLFLLLFCKAIAQANRFDVLITEIMADPSPMVGLPNAEWIEIKNLSAQPLNLKGWKLGDASSVTTINTSYILLPDSFLILCSNSNVTLMNTWGTSLGLSSFPSLDNDGDQLVLWSATGQTIHAVAYNSSWYNNDLKKEGGWSLEMIDTGNPCSSNNWRASNSSVGGSPGKTNSVIGNNRDEIPPGLLRTFAQDSLSLLLYFDEALDSNSAAIAGNYQLTDRLITAAIPQAPLFNTVLLRLSSPLQKRKIYTVAVKEVRDCSGNPIGAYHTAAAGLAEEAVKTEIVINEILFNPRPDGTDYIEVYNNSDKILNAAHIYIGGRDVQGTVTSLKKISEVAFAFFPGEYLVVTANSIALQKQFMVKSPEKVLTLSSLPSMPDDKGTILILNATGDVLDEVAYDDDWHFALLDDKEGIALERLDPSALSQDKNNWHSAAATSGYGTPTYQNSQFKTTEAKAIVDVIPAVFSPDNDGHDDIATVGFLLSETGYVANIIIFDAYGTMVKNLARNTLLGLKNHFHWDGLDERQKKLPAGIYIIYTELFNLQGKKKIFKKTVVLVR